MFKTEIYKILSRKITLICSVIIFLFMAVQMHVSTIGEEGVIGDGKAYVREAAIQKDKEIAAVYEGPLTMEKVEDIWNRYGEPINHSREDAHVNLEKGTADLGFEDNYCNRFVADYFFDQEFKNDGSIVYTPLDKERAAVYLDPDLYFAYAGGWTYYWDAFLTFFVLVCILIIIAVCPICADEYSLRTADVILTTQKGRGRLFAVKTGAALACSSLMYWFFMGAQFLMYAAAYGTGGLKCSTVFIHMNNYYGKVSAGGTIAVILLCGWLSHSALTVLVIAVSSRSKQTFTSVIWSLFFYLMPMALMIIVLARQRRTLFIRLLTFFLSGTPSALFTSSFLEMPAYMRLWLSAVLAVITGTAVIYAARRYCRHQI